ncbi:MAG: histidine kinase [Planctomycetota bacterium]
MRAHPEPATERARGLEAWLRRPLRRALLALGFVLLATTMNSIGSIELRQARGFGPSIADTLSAQALNWSLLVALATPLGYVLVQLARRLSAWSFAAALCASTSLVAGALFYQQYETARWFSDFGRPARPEGERRPRGDGEALRDGPPDAISEAVLDAASEPAPSGASETGPGGPQERRSGRGPRSFGPNQGRAFGGAALRGDSLAWSVRFRLPRVVLATWAFVGLGAAVRLFLDAREREREARLLELRAGALEGELAVAQLEALRAQLHPHFLFNALHSIGGLVRSARSDDALRTLDALGGLLRLGLEARGDSFVTLDEELRLLQRYLDVERVRLGERLRLEVETAAEVREDEVPTFLLQPLVENAVRYAVAERAEGGRVRVAARARGRSLVIDIDDDGPGYPARVIAGEGWGIGLSNVRARLATLFEHEGHLELTRSEWGGARARVTLPRDAEDAL